MEIYVEAFCYQRDNSVRWFFAHSIMFGEVIVVFGENSPREAQFFCRFVYSPYTAKYSWRILQIRLSSLSVFSMHAKILLAYLETTLYIKITLKIAAISVYA
jgi:hypothetical protein